MDNANDTDGKCKRNDQVPQPLPLDLAEAINGMYRLLDLISETGSNGNGKKPQVAVVCAGADLEC